MVNIEKKSIPNTTDINEEESTMKNEMVSIKEIIAQDKQQKERKVARMKEVYTNQIAYTAISHGCNVTSPEIRQAASELLKLVPEDQLLLSADIVLRKELSTSGAKYAYETDKVCLVWEKNKHENRRPYIIWVHEKAKPRKVNTMEDKAVSFFMKRIPGMPEEVIRELFKTCFDGKEFKICQYNQAEPIILMSNQKPGGKFTLQNIDSDGRFAVNHPIAYVIGNCAYVSIPFSEPGRPWTFRAQE